MPAGSSACPPGSLSNHHRDPVGETPVATPSIHGAANRGTGVPPVRTAGMAVPLRDAKLLKPLSVNRRVQSRQGCDNNKECPRTARNLGTSLERCNPRKER